jgi:hypothetical protein
MPTLKREDKASKRDSRDEDDHDGDRDRDRDRDRDEELIRDTLVNLGAAKKYQKWLSFVKLRMVLGFDRIPKHIQPDVATKPRGLVNVSHQFPYFLWINVDGCSHSLNGVR